MKFLILAKIISGISDNARINVQVTDSAVDNIRPSLADFLSHPDLPSVHTKSAVLFESRSPLEAKQNEKAPRIFPVMDHATVEFLSKTDIRIPFDRSFDLPACHGHRVLFEIALSRIMQYFNSYRTSKGRHVRGTEKGDPGNDHRDGSSLTRTINNVHREFQQSASLGHKSTIYLMLDR